MYININLFKQNKLNKDHRRINMRAFIWNLKNFVPLNTSYSFKGNKQKYYKETEFPWEYKCGMQSLFTDNTILCLCPEAAKWSKNVFSLKKCGISLNIYSWAQNRKLFPLFNNPKKTSSRLFKKYIWNENNNKKISWKSHQSQWSLHDNYGQSKAKDWW